MQRRVCPIAFFLIIVCPIAFFLIVVWPIAFFLIVAFPNFVCPILVCPRTRLFSAKVGQK
jgi:hypothetical protein